MKRERKIQYSVLRVYSQGYTEMAQWLSWLERRPVTAEVTGSSPVWVVDSRDGIGRMQVYSSQHKGVLAQLGEHLPYKQRVIGSSPIGPIF